MNKLEMQTLESSRLARMTTTERANHNRVKREILDARGPELVRDHVTVDPENPRRLNIDMTVQLAGNIHKLSEEVAIAFGELAAVAAAPDAELIVDAWDKYTRGDVIRRSVIGDEEFAKLAYCGWIAPVKRPGDATARDYVVAEDWRIADAGGQIYYAGETVPGPGERVEGLRVLLNQGAIELAK